jgi:hypothetical protein
MFAGADSLRDKEEGQREDGFLQSAIKTTNTYCKSDIKAVGDWASFKGALNDGGKHVGALCAQAIEGIRAVCAGGDDGKQAVREGIATFRCAFGESDVKLDGKVVTYTTKLDDTRTGVTPFVREYLRKHL